MGIKCLVIFVFLLAGSVSSIAVEPSVLNASYVYHCDGLPDPPESRVVGSWPVVSPTFHNLVYRSWDRSVSTGASHAVLVLHGGQNMMVDALAEVTSAGDIPGAPAPPDISLFGSINYYCILYRKQPWAPAGILVPAKFQARVHAYAYGGTVNSGQAYAKALVQMYWQGTGPEVYAEVNAVSGHSNATGQYWPDTQELDQTWSISVQVDYQNLILVYAKAETPGVSQSTVWGTGWGSTAQAIADPAFFVDPSATIEVGGTSYPANELYGIAFSPGFSDGTNPLPPYSLWVSDHGLVLAGDGAAGFDKDLDGIPNAVEFAIGSDPFVPNIGGPLSCAIEGSDFVVRFKRSDESESVAVSLQTSSDLLTWPNEIVIPPGPASGPEVTVVDKGPLGADEVTVRIPKGTPARKFVRLRVVIP